MKSKKFLVVDTWLIAKASSEEEKEYDIILKVQSLLLKIYNECHIVVLDLPENEIWKEWKPYLYGSLFTRNWHKGMQSSGKLDRRNRRKLQLGSFPDPDDEKFVQLAATLSNKIVITGDPQFIGWGESEEAKKLSIQVWDIEKALKEL